MRFLLVSSVVSTNINQELEFTYYKKYKYKMIVRFCLNKRLITFISEFTIII